MTSNEPDESTLELRRIDKAYGKAVVGTMENLLWADSRVRAFWVEETDPDTIPALDLILPRLMEDVAATHRFIDLNTAFRLAIDPQPPLSDKAENHMKDVVAQSDLYEKDPQTVARAMDAVREYAVTLKANYSSHSR